MKSCIRAEFKNYNLTASKVTRSGRALNYEVTEHELEQIVDEHVYEPPGYMKYSSSGCKRVPFLVRTFISKKNYRILDEL